jgi:hypothetical protein
MKFVVIGLVVSGMLFAATTFAMTVMGMAVGASAATVSDAMWIPAVPSAVIGATVAWLIRRNRRTPA